MKYDPKEMHQNFLRIIENPINKREVTIMEEQEKFLKRLARDNGITVEEMNQYITARIRRGLVSPESSVRRQWEMIPCIGEIPTPEEYLGYVLKRIYEEGREDLLRRYLIK